jgi:mono/diheme cytochrome c family protein
VKSFLAECRSLEAWRERLPRDCCALELRARRVYRIAAFLSAAVFLILTRPQVQAQNPAPKPASSSAGNVENGQRLYISYGCYECHGREGQGSTATGPRIASRSTALLWFIRYVRQPSGQMPPYTNKVASDADLADIHAFLEARPQPAKAESIPLLK